MVDLKKNKKIRVIYLKFNEDNFRLISRAKQIPVIFRSKMNNPWRASLFVLEFAATFCPGLIKKVSDASVFETKPYIALSAYAEPRNRDKIFAQS